MLQISSPPSTPYNLASLVCPQLLVASYCSCLAQAFAALDVNLVKFKARKVLDIHLQYSIRIHLVLLRFTFRHVFVCSLFQYHPTLR